MIGNTELLKVVEIMLKDFTIERKANQGYTIVSVLFNPKMVIIYIAKRCDIHVRTFSKGLQNNNKDLKISTIFQAVIFCMCMSLPINGKS